MIRIFGKIKNKNNKTIKILVYTSKSLKTIRSEFESTITIRPFILKKS